MSYSSELKEILCKTQYECPSCRLSELAGFFACAGKNNDDEIHIQITNPQLSKRVLKALGQELGINADIDGKKIKIKGRDYSKLTDELVGDVMIYECCKIAYVRGAFLGGGSVNAPDKKYHMEFGAKTKTDADKLTEILIEFEFKPKQTVRKDKYIVYIKESSQIAELLGYISNGRAGLEFLSAQVEKGIISSAQRQANCDSANLNKLAKASSKHITAIKQIKAARKWASLPDVLREIGELRLKHPDLSLEELGRMTSRGVGKSGVNHRLNRIVEYANTIGKG